MKIVPKREEKCYNKGTLIGKEVGYEDVESNAGSRFCGSPLCFKPGSGGNGLCSVEPDAAAFGKAGGFPVIEGFY